MASTTVIAARLSHRETQLLDTAAAIAGRTRSDLLRAAVGQIVHETLNRRIAEEAGDGDRARVPAGAET